MTTGESAVTTDAWPRRCLILPVIAAALVFGVNAYGTPVCRLGTDAGWAVASGAAAGRLFWRLGAGHRSACCSRLRCGLACSCSAWLGAAVRTHGR